MRAQSDPSMVWTQEDREGVAEAVAGVVFKVKPAATAGTIDSVKRLVKLKLKESEAVWDRHPWLLPCANGVLDLHTQTLLDDPSPELYITKVAPAAYDRKAERDLVEAHVKMLFDGDDALVHCFQKQVGAALVGNAETEKPQVFVVLIGPSGGGKGTSHTPCPERSARTCPRSTPETSPRRRLSGTSHGCVTSTAFVWRSSRS